MFPVRPNYGLLAISALVLSVIVIVASADTLWISQDQRSLITPDPVFARQDPAGVLPASRTPLEHRPMNVQGGCIPAWEAESSPQLSRFTILQGVAVVAPDDAWAVGYYIPDGQSEAKTQIMRWDGTQWTLVLSPNVASSSNYLFDVAAVSADDVWAVGYSVNGSTAQTLIMHWDGGAWGIVPSPNFGSGSNALSDVAVISTNDVWAVGDYGYPASQTLILHWDGTGWAVASSPNASSYNILNSVTALSSNDVWAVGLYTVGSTASTLTLHWDGSSWSIVPSPNRDASQNILEDVTAVSANDVWAVGWGDPPYTLIMHWNGTKWENYPNTIRGRLYGVTALASDDVWAVGDISLTLIVHWNGDDWSIAHSPNPGILGHTLRAVHGIAANNVWAVGASSWAGDSSQTLTEHYTGQCVTPTPTRAATLTPTIHTSTPTFTSIPTSTPTTSPAGETATTQPTTVGTATHIIGSATPDATPTICSIQFVDVPVGSTFYPYVRCLACRNIISGYPDGTFKPQNNATRGQIAKIISNAAGLQYPPGSQIFQDVAPGSTFYDFIWRLADRGYVGGYPCGGPGEPCEPGNLPFFRPNANITRGQISKIVASAGGFSDTSGAQQFEDVAPGSTFYDWIWRLAHRSIMGGYACGGAGEPCVGPGNRPYFRPGANATRGQISKIVANTFFPDCSTLLATTLIRCL
ncbi:MAG TPA: S-layer homology domain-containing protein [Chloroflexia bacterium]|jgi:hypothetical protein